MQSINKCYFPHIDFRLLLITKIIIGKLENLNN